MDGFFIPFAMFRPYNGSGLLCGVLGLTPVRRIADLRVLQDYLMKEAYEHEIEMLMCQVRLHEFAFHRHFCKEDRAEERYARRIDGSANADAEAPEMTAPDTRQVILNAVTWRYDWIQRYKKPCFQFAEAVIDCKVLPVEKRDVALKRRGVSLAEQEQFMEKFIREAAAMPEPNRKLVDFMYEAAWRILFEYRYGYLQDKVSAPWYDCLGNTAVTEQQTKPAAPAELTELTAPAETHEEGSDGKSGC